jgi:glucose/mannose transport system permease protein
MLNALSANESPQATAGFRETLGAWAPRMAIAPGAIASLVYVFGFTLWTLYISVSNSTMLPTYKLVGLKPYFDLWSNARWKIAYGNLFYFSAFYVVLSLAVGLALAIAIDQRVRGEAIWRTIFLYPLAVSFVVTGTVWSWLYSPGIWQSSGFAMALILAGLRSVDPDIVKAAQIDGAGPARIYRKVIIPSIAPIFVAVIVVLLQFAIKTFDLVVALTRGGPGIATTFPANYVYDLMFQRGQIAIGAAAAIMMLAALAVVLVPYALWTVWRSGRGAAHG